MKPTELYQQQLLVGVIIPDYLYRMRWDASPATFKAIWGEIMGLHLWDKFIDYKRNMLDLWVQLDNGNKLALVAHILEEKQLVLVIDQETTHP